MMGADGGRELREFIRRLTTNDDRLRALERQAAGLRTGIRDLWAFGGGAGGFDFTAFHGSVGACFLTGGVEAVLEVRDQSTGAVVATVNANTAGAFGPVSLVYQAPSQIFDLIVTPTSVRLDPLVTTLTVTSAITTQNYSLVAASGYACWFASGASYPIATTLSVNDSRFGTGSIIRGGWAPHFSDDWTTPATFPAVPQWRMEDSQRFFDTTVGGNSSGLVVADITAYTPPDIVTKMSITWTAPAGNALYTAGDTVTVFEP